jgi:hypothetical protein
VLKDQILDLTDQLLNSGGSLSDGESVDNGNQGSANNRRRVDDNWYRNFVLNWRLNPNAQRFRGRGLNRCRLNWSRTWNWSLSENGSWCRWRLNQIWEHDPQRLLNPETDDLSPQRIQVDVTSWFENVLSNLSLCVQQ